MRNKMNNNFKNLILFIALILSASNTFAQSGGTFVIEKSVIAGGGASDATGGNFKIDGTIGQAAAGERSPALPFSLQNGFWNATPLSPSAAAVSVSGKVSTPDGRGLRNAVVAITDSHGVKRMVTTSSFGFYVFYDVAVGDTYVVSVSSKLYRFQSMMLQVTDTLTGVDFVGQE
jgi:hypothetical protein